VLIESQPADSAYFLLDGTAEVRRQGATLASLGAGQLVGEAALVEHRTRNASVITTSPVRVLRWSYEDLESVFDRHSEVADVFADQHRRRAS
jgi:CRP-like cAMP-binding protein